jgi:hypothetical protein
VLHAILVDGVIERIEGTPDVADAEVLKQRKARHVSGYLFAARSEEEVEQKKKNKIQCSRPVYPNNTVVTARTKEPRN